MLRFRRLVETVCFECVIDVVAWSPLDGEAVGTMNVGLLSFPSQYECFSLRGRLRRAWQALRGDVYPWLNFVEPQEVERVVTALRDAADVAFPSSQPQP